MRGCAHGTTQMGLGKTLESLMLVLSNPAPAGWASEGHPPLAHPQQQQQQQRQQEGQGMDAEGGEAEGGSAKAARGSKRGREDERDAGAATAARAVPSARGASGRRRQAPRAWAQEAAEEAQAGQRKPVARRKPSKKNEEAEGDDEPVPIKTTLLVVPANLIPQWCALWRAGLHTHVCARGGGEEGGACADPEVAVHTLSL